MTTPTEDTGRGQHVTGGGVWTRYSNLNPLTCDRCGFSRWDVWIRPDFSCCRVPLCDACAKEHSAEIAFEAGKCAASASSGLRCRHCT